MNGLVETEKELLAEKEDIAAQLKQLETQRDDIEKSSKRNFNHRRIL